MLSFTRFRATCAHRRDLAHGVLLAITLAAGGCSADVTRFDFPAFGLTENKPTGSLPSQGMARGPGYDSGASGPQRSAGYEGNRPYPPPPGYAPPPTYNAPPTYSSLPPPSGGERIASARDYAPSPPPMTEAPPAAPDRYARRSYDRSPPAADRREPPKAMASGETIQVQQGDTLYGLAKRHGVSIIALIEVNGLTHGSAIKPGQRLMLPADAGAAGTESPPARTAARTPVPAAAAPPAQAQAHAPPGWEGRHTMKSGQSLYGIARHYKVSLSELQRVNGITEPTRVRMGAVLIVPGTGDGTSAAQPTAGAPRMVQTQPIRPQPRIINAVPGEARTAALTDPTTDASPGAEPAAPRASTPSARGPAHSAGTGRFRWPARGRVIAAFGKRTDGSHNDGINIALPQGTEVHAAEGGRVAYAGSELKGYGNLILIRHDNGWVSAYAHADQMLVKRDDVVRRGQVIAKAGKTGTVDQPQLHFELRQGAKPVDPLPYMER